MQKCEKFYIEKQEFDETSWIAKFHYSFDKIEHFVEEIDFLCMYYDKRKEIDISTVHNLLAHLSIALSISYYKLYPTKDIIVENCLLDDQDILFWKKFFVNGLWEFLFKNNISPEWLFEFKNAKISEEWVQKIWKDFQVAEKFLLPIGWGKDSIVSSMMIDAIKTQYTPFVFWKIDDIKQAFISETKKDGLLVKRTLSPRLFEMNQEGYYNGHVPITGIISFVLVVTAYLYDYKYIVFSNEKSADEENVMLGNIKVNHQYSKSLEFENDMRGYIKKNLSSNIEYFSILRGLYELKIAQIFALKWKKFFPIFSSCNKNFTIQKRSLYHSFWCCECPKCLFVYMILRPFISHEDVLSIWWKELYNEQRLLPVFQELIWEIGFKPFECVGEKEEALLAVYLSLQKFDKEVPFLCKYFKDTIYPKYNDDFFIRLKDRYGDNGWDNNIPKKLQEEIRLWLEKEII